MQTEVWNAAKTSNHAWRRPPRESYWISQHEYLNDKYDPSHCLIQWPNTPTTTFPVVTHLTYLLLHPAAYVAECEQSNWYNNKSRQITVLGNFVSSSNLMVTSFAVNSIPFWSRSELITGNLLNYWPVTGCIIWVWRFKTYTTLNVSMIHTQNIWSGPKGDDLLEILLHRHYFKGLYLNVNDCKCIRKF